MSAPTATRENNLGVNLERIYKELKVIADTSGLSTDNDDAVDAYNHFAEMLNEYYTTIGDTRTPLATNYASAGAVPTAAELARNIKQLNASIIYLQDLPANQLKDRTNNFDAYSGAFTTAQAAAIVSMQAQLAAY